MIFKFKGKVYDTDSDRTPTENWPLEVKKAALKHYFLDQHSLDNMRKVMSFDEIVFEYNVLSEREENFLSDVTDGKISKPGTYSAWILQAHNDVYTANEIVHDDLIGFAKDAKTLDELKSDILAYANDFKG